MEWMKTPIALADLFQNQNRHSDNEIQNFMV